MACLGTLARDKAMAVRLKPLQQHVIVITGASSGIGLCIALLAAEKGASVVLAARSDAIVVQIGAAGGQAIAVPTDVGDRAQLQGLTDAGMIVASPKPSWRPPPKAAGTSRSAPWRR